MAEKTFAKKLFGWAITDDDEAEASARPEELVERYVAKKEPPPPPVVELRGPLPAASADGTVKFPDVYASAEITADAQERVERALLLIQSLPNDTPMATKKQIVEASLKAFGFPIDRLIETAAQQMQALESYIRSAQRETQDALMKGNARIEELTRQIAEQKNVLESRVMQQQSVTRTTNAEKVRLQPVLEFFGHDAVLKVVQESPKLVEPKK